jgi:hypothetical protein
MIRFPALALLVVCAVFGAGCGKGGGEGGSTLVVTRDFGEQVVAPARFVAASKGMTAMRQLQTALKTETSYGGRYVASIDGVREDDDSSWMLYIDGIEATRGAAAMRLSPGQQVQWDFHPWQTIRTGGAIVGGYPLPLKRSGVHLVCAAPERADCAATRKQLAAAGVRVAARASARVVVGSWNEIQGFDGVPELESSGESNGAYAQFSGGGKRLTPYFADGSAARASGRGSGLIAAFASGDELTWLVTGTDAAGVRRAAGLLENGGRALENRFAVIVGADGRAGGLPVGEER